MKRAWSSRLAWWIACAAICGAVACGDDDGASGGEGSGGENGAGGSAANAGGGLENHELHYDLHAQAHLAEVEHQGLFVDFGTPAQAKYTVGDWNSGWGSRGSEGDLTFANVGRRARLYVHLDEPTNLQVKLHLRPKGTRAVTPYVNNTQHQSIFFEGESWQDVTFSIPASDTRRGENYILLTFGGVTNVGGEEVSVQLASARFVPGDSIPDVEPPSWGTYAANVSLGGAAKPAVVYATPHAFTWYAEIPEGGKLAFGAGQEGQAGGTGRVYVTAEGGERQKVWEGALTNAWSGQTVDLSSYAGKIVQIRFEAEGGQGRAAWAEPRVMRPVAEVAEVGQARNVVVVLVDTLRASKLKTWNPQSRVRTPAVDALASEGVVFERGNSTENWTKPAVAAVLTGLHPMDHGAAHAERGAQRSRADGQRALQVERLQDRDALRERLRLRSLRFRPGLGSLRQLHPREPEQRLVERLRAGRRVGHGEQGRSRFFLYVHDRSARSLRSGRRVPLDVRLALGLRGPGASADDRVSCSCRRRRTRRR
ncbi:MAG: sulfatase-like hydrolase/transferase [Sandaracinus sp.]|nr:sulfatase-like hydrolase/transferase [Sandaracinus sp.]